MPRKTLQFAALLAASLLTLHAQQPSNGTPPEGRAAPANGITIPSVAGAPFSATVVIESQRYWPDGSVEVRRTINLIARDSKGRTHNETRRLMPESFHGSPQLMSVRLFDPESRIRTIYDPALHIARRQFIPKQPKAPDFPNPFVHVEDLGATTLDGLPAKGTRRTFTVSASAGGTGEPIEIEDEDWYSEDLHLNLLVRHSDPRIGMQTIAVSAIKREEPPASLFEVPQGYKILDVIPAPAPAPATQPAPGNTTP
ncbi:MAG: hypothetical protein ABSG62_04075 [Terracidiphilus sp.]|jgi:hypothetical protein